MTKIALIDSGLLISLSILSCNNADTTKIAEEKEIEKDTLDYFNLRPKVEKNMTIHMR